MLIEDSLAYYRKSAELWEHFRALNPNDTEAQRDLMIVYGHIADRLGHPFFYGQGDSKGALEYYRKAAGIAEAMSAADPANQLARYDLGMVYSRIGTVLVTDREAPESLKMLDRSAAILESIVAEAPKSPLYRYTLAVVYGNKGKRLQQLSEYRPALGYYQRSLQFAAALGAENPNYYNSQDQMLAAKGGI